MARLGFEMGMCDSKAYNLSTCVPWVMEPEQPATGWRECSGKGLEPSFQGPKEGPCGAIQ